MTGLDHRKVLVVEDEALIAAMLTDALADAGAVLIGPANNLEEALDLIKMGPEVAILDVNLNGTMVYPVADALLALGIPFVLTSGYAQTSLDNRFQVPIFEKPYDADEVVAAVGLLLAESAKANNHGDERQRPA